MRTRFIPILIAAAIFGSSAIGQSPGNPVTVQLLAEAFRKAHPEIVNSAPTSIAVVDLSGAPAHDVIVVIDGQPYNAVARPAIDPPGPTPGPLPNPPGPLPPPAPAPTPNPDPAPAPTPVVTPIDVATHIFVTYVYAGDTHDQDVLSVAKSEVIDASLKASLNAEWTSLDANTQATALATRHLDTYVAGTGLPCVVVQDDQGNVYDEFGKRVDPNSQSPKPHAIPAPKTEKGVTDLITKLRGK